MPDMQTLSSARQLAATDTVHFPNESAAYRTARNALLAEEIAKPPTCGQPWPPPIR
jgi:hypothetical protein